MYSNMRKRSYYDIRRLNSSLSKQNSNNVQNTNNVQIIDILKNKKTPFVDYKINILLRVSYRPNYFSVWIKSVLEQKYKNFNIICCYDDINSKEYLEKVQDRRFSYFYIENDSKEHYTYLLERVQDGWIIFLDDEEQFTDDLSLAKINNLLNYTDDINKIIFWKVKNQENIIDIPFNNGETQDEIIYSSSQYCFHSKYKFLVQNNIASKEKTTLSKLLNSLTFKLYGFNEILVKLQTINNRCYNIISNIRHLNIIEKKYLEYFNNKKIIIVGNGNEGFEKNVSNLYIDSHDIIVRINSYKIIPEISGIKTDIHFMSTTNANVHTKNEPIYPNVNQCKFIFACNNVNFLQRLNRLVKIKTPIIMWNYIIIHSILEKIVNKKTKGMSGAYCLIIFIWISLQVKCTINYIGFGKHKINNYQQEYYWGKRQISQTHHLYHQLHAFDKQFILLDTLDIMKDINHSKCKK